MALRVLVASVVAAVLLGACGADDSPSRVEDDAPTSTATTGAEPGSTTTTIAPVTIETPGAEAMCRAVRSTAGEGTGSTAIERTVRGQLERWSAVAGAAPEALLGYAETLAAYYTRSLETREEFAFDTEAQLRAGRAADTRQSAEEQIASIQMDAAVETLCNQDPPGVFTPVEVDTEMLEFCAHFAENSVLVVDAEVGSAAYNEAFWTGRAALWRDAVDLAPDEVVADVEVFADRYDRILEVYESVAFDTTEGVKAGILRARTATDEEAAALATVSDYLLASCDVTETGDLGAMYQP